MLMEISDKGVAFIKQWESFKAQAYWDESGHVWTVGYGSTWGVTKDTVVTKEKATVWLKRDCGKIEKYLNSLGLKINQKQFDALVCFAYNVGLANLKKSSLMRYVLHSAPVTVVENEFHKWRKSGGKVLEGLEIRREGEGMLYTGIDYPTRAEAVKHINERLKTNKYK